MTIKRHFYKKPNVDMQAWPLDPLMANTINAESFVYYDTTAKYLVALASDSNAAYFVGLLQDQTPVGNYGSIGFDQGGGTTNPNTNNQGMVVRYGQAKMNCTVGQSYTAGQKVCIGADAQTVSTSGSNYIAYVSGEQADITTATAGQTVLVDFRANYPAVPVN